MANEAIFLLITVCISASAMFMPKPTENYQHNVVLDEDQRVHLYWKYDDSDITFELHVETTGWLGLGISPSGGMRGADIAIGWVDDGTDRRELHDTFATEQGLPTLDVTQNLVLLATRQCEGITMIKFSRKLLSCDAAQDLSIKDGTIRLIYAYGDEDPANIGSVRYHGIKRGVRSLRLLQPLVSLPTTADNVRRIQILNDNFLVPERDTVYWCKAFKFPELSEKHHVIQINPIIQPENKGVVHHILLYRCYHTVNDSLHGYENICRGPMPGDLNSCFNVWASWAIGGGDFHFPAHVGYPVGGGFGPEFLLIETHYDNPELRADIRDSSGLELVLTTDLREHDAGIMQVGKSVHPTHVVPPKYSEFISRAHCSSECLKKTMGDTIPHVNVFAVMQHAHLLGRRMSTHLVRDGEEVASLGLDNYYDFNLQETRYLPAEVKVFPDDRIIVDCIYDSRNRNKVTLGGLSTKDEMCLDYLYYYPTLDISNCESGIIPNHHLEFAGATKYNEQTYLIEEPASLAGLNFVQAMNRMNWSDPAIRAAFQELELDSETYKYYECKVKGDNLLDDYYAPQKTFTPRAAVVVPPCSASPRASDPQDLVCAIAPLHVLSPSLLLALLFLIML